MGDGELDSHKKSQLMTVSIIPFHKRPYQVGQSVCQFISRIPFDVHTCKEKKKWQRITLRG